MEYLGKWSEMEFVFVPQCYPLDDELFLLFYFVGVPILQHSVTCYCYSILFDK